MTWSRFLLLLLLAGCARKPEGFVLRPLVGTGSFTVTREIPAGLSFPAAPEVSDLEIDHERRPIVLTRPGTWRWHGVVPENGDVHAGVQILPAAWKAVRSLEARLEVRDGDTREILDWARATEPRWLNLEADLSRYAGREITLELTAELPGLPADHLDDNLVAWGPVSLSAPEEQERPNVLFILVDTLRYDHVTAYGYTRNTTPEIQRRLADPGAVVEEAYSQAPWTLPSVVSFLTGRYPGELLSPEMSSFGIPDGIEPLAERMARLGYQTAGFVANPTLHAGAGFDRGFRTYFAPPADILWMQKHADDLNAHAIPWLKASQDRPFFAYVHYIDPHDPYRNPDMEPFGGRAPFQPGYEGPVDGGWIHGIYTGELQLPDPPRDVHYIKALYDSEVSYVDRHIGELLAALDPEVLSNTLVVLTADHGEELFDHGGWKHGQSLYEEQIHVPLIFRWDGHIKPGTRLPGTVRLVDLVPTLAAAVGMEPDPDWDGIDLLPALTGKGSLPRKPAFAQHLSSGPLRAAAVLNGRKLILYNRNEPFQPGDPLQAHLYGIDQARFRRVELYDVEADPRERRPLNEPLGDLDTAIRRNLEAFLPGLWVLGNGSGTITFERAPQRWVPYFLGNSDRVEMSGNRIAYDLTAEPFAKGFRVEGDPGRVLSPTPGLSFWRHEGKTVKRRAADPETERRL
ncbi:MAG TPA: sulfatase, partial [Thermoanaerobaculia bacterium]|nr:sulfatase [Thermoanaerobaculia bacterium]